MSGGRFNAVFKTFCEMDFSQLNQPCRSKESPRKRHDFEEGRIDGGEK
jgi:hypothetical protein